MIPYASERRRRLIRRGLPALGAVASISLVLGLLLGSEVRSGAEQAAVDYVEAWERGDWQAMHRLLTPDSRRRVAAGEFAEAHRAAVGEATAVTVEAEDPDGERDGRQIVPMIVRTRIFGEIRGELALPVRGEDVAWAPHLVFPGLDEGVSLTRRSKAPERAAILSRDDKVLAEGPAETRSSPLGPLSSSIAGRLEPEETALERNALYARGFPHDWPVGQSGLEAVFERRLRGRPGGELLAGTRVVASARPRAARPVRTTIDTGVQEAADLALAGRFGGIAALDARTGEVRALAGVAFSAPQPPGSTFKIVTTTAALESRLVRPRDEFPVEQAAIIDGVELENANGEFCGGTFTNSFAHSCNSVFAPLGVKVGAERLVAAAERYGFNEERTLPGELPSTIPPAADITSPLEVGATAIGQGRVLATPLMLASIAQTVAAGGVRSEPTLAADHPRTRRTRVTSRRVARTLGRLMIGVVDYGTGTASAIPGVKVAGKTGTAELEDTRGPNAEEAASDPSNTDAWFTAYAPAGRPRIAAAAMFVRAGAGGAVAAPAVRIVLEAGLAR
ncbi:MAG TPA: penicillin-binding transpeptidase domain-containing protein [Thermoleophilaceae bacterium]|nr:penicillin-binding transpeptidase domain-containing protein [Thermoleophilaceae bacterium]